MPRAARMIPHARLSINLAAVLSLLLILLTFGISNQSATAMSAFYEGDTEPFPVQVVVEGELRGEPFRLVRTTFCYSYFEFSHGPTPRWRAFMGNFGAQLTPSDGVIFNTRIKCDKQRPKGNIPVKKPLWFWVDNLCDIRRVETADRSRRDLEDFNFDDSIYPITITSQYYTFDLDNDHDFDDENINIPGFGADPDADVDLKYTKEFGKIKGFALLKPAWSQCKALPEAIAGSHESGIGRISDWLEISDHKGFFGLCPKLSYQKLLNLAEENAKPFSLESIAPGVWDLRQPKVGREIFSFLGEHSSAPNFSFWKNYRSNTGILLEKTKYGLVYSDHKIAESFFSSIRLFIEYIRGFFLFDRKTDTLFILTHYEKSHENGWPRTCKE